MNAAFRITNNTVVTVVNKSAYIYQVLIAISVTPDNYKFHMQNRESPPKILVPPYTLYVEPDIGGSVPFRPPNPRYLHWDYPHLMKDGIAMQVTGGAGPLDVSVWVDYETADF